ncbi:transcriptional regulator GcvA [Silvimonas amylolytica]|uniref:DNA-binding transcriptional activator GcvA n=1 Tax=Silvimonas amylolytica TaxID=449663 RepID=A0ABQ2PPV4_9NEIS|nr:transcriptional regulator GcvA [Silvimonas amylolytica]GGP27231.1 DNA-binding transcriptional activator GcvA [Silvimonas amylolytica]
MDSPLKPPGRLPSLSALRAFEAAARLGNLARAADELFVTHGAVSHQIKTLESQLGFRLFSRNGRGVVLTAPGQRLANILNGAFNDIAGEIAAIAQEQQRPRLVITCLPSFAAKWLTPRLGEFISKYPDVELWIRSTKTPENLVAEEIDLGIRVGEGKWPGVHLEHLMDDEFVVVASPNLPGGLPATPADLLNRVLLRSDTEPWERWFAAAGVAGAPALGSMVFNDSALLVQAAAQGQGVGLARASLIQPELAEGTLIPLFDLRVRMPGAYWIVTPDAPPWRPAVQTFVSWLKTKVQER